MGVEELQAKCSKCGKPFRSIDDYKKLLDQNNKTVFICNECAEKYKENYKPFPVMDSGVWLFALLALMFAHDKGIK